MQRASPATEGSDPRSGVRRFLLALAAVPFSLVVVFLLLADRAPGITIGWLRQAWQIGSAVQARLGVDLIDRDNVPLSVDSMGHLAIWFVAGLFAHALLARFARLRTLFLWLLLVSAGFEVAQGFLTVDRKVQLSDGVANGIGALAGLVVAAIVTTIIGSTRQVRLAEA